MLSQTKLVVLRKAVYQNAFLAFENRLKADLLLSCLGRYLRKLIKYFTSNQIAIYLALNVEGRKYKYDVQSVCYEEFCC